MLSQLSFKQKILLNNGDEIYDLYLTILRVSLTVCDSVE